MFKNKKSRLVLIVLIISLGIAYYFYNNQQNTKLIGSINCGLSKIDVRLDVRPNALEGDIASYKVQYSTDKVRDITIGGGSLINSFVSSQFLLPLNTNIKISRYSSSSLNTNLILSVSNDKLASHSDIKYHFSEPEYEYLDSCLQKNIVAFNNILASLPSSLPSGVKNRATVVASAPQLIALVYVDGLQLTQLLQSAGINYSYLVFSSEGDDRIIRVSDSGALRFDYYSDVGLDIFSTDFSKPLPEEYLWLSEYKNNNMTLIDFLMRVQKKVPVIFSDN